MSKFQFSSITADTSQISALDDRPQIASSVLKSKFDGGANEIKTQLNAQFSAFNSAVTDSVSDDSTDEQIPTAKSVNNAIENKMTEIGAGDMAKSIYDKNSSGVVDNSEKVEDKTVNDIMKTLYPVGSIYMSTNNVNPSTWIDGTTWEQWGAGRVPIGVGGSYTTPNVTGGADSVTLSTNNIPSHSHSYSFSGSTGTQSANHTHTFSGTTGYNNVSHTHNYGSASIYTNNVTSAGGYLHLNTGGSEGWLSLASDFTTTNQSANHIHTFSGTTSGISANHAHSFSGSGSVSATGGGQAISIVQSYVTCYMWRRTV